jgi:hypothetical protein
VQDRSAIPILEYEPPRDRRREYARFAAWVVAVVALLGGTLAWLWFLRGDRILHNDAILWGGWLALGAVVLFIAALLATTPQSAIRLPASRSRQIILVGTVALQVASLYFLVPALSEDALRYRLDGSIWLDRTSPYAVTPTDYLNRQNVVWDRLNHLMPFQERRTIYPPVGQAVFASLRATEPMLPLRWWFGFGPPVTHWRDVCAIPEAAIYVLPQRIAFAAAAVVCASVLLLALNAIRVSPWWAVLFAWNPLVVLETGAMAHVDIVGVLLVLSTVYCLQRRRPLCAAGMLALAVGIKPIAIVLAPWFLRETADRRAAWQTLGLFASVLLLTWAPPLIYQQGYRGFFDSLHQYATRWEFNGSFYELVKYLFGGSGEGWPMEHAKRAARSIAPVILALTGAALWVSRASFVQAGYWLCLISLLVAPVVYPWYLLWMLCFVPLVRAPMGWTGLTFAATVGVSYVVWHEPTWRVPAWAMLAQYAPVYAVLAIELTMLYQRARVRREVAATASASASESADRGSETRTRKAPRPAT